MGALHKAIVRPGAREATEESSQRAWANMTLPGIVFAAMMIVFSPAGVWGQETSAPELTLTDLNGRTVRLSDYHGKVVLINFWATWCPPCRAEMPDLVKLQ